MSVGRAGAAVVAHNGFVYMMGGVDGRVYLRTVEYAPVLEDGRLGEWRRTSILPEARGFTDAVVKDHFIYVVGGGKGAHGQELLSSTVRAPIQPDGSLGPWSTVQASLNLPRRCSKVCLADNRLIALGGFGGTLLDSVEIAGFGANGRLQDWRLQAQSLLLPRYVNAVKKYRNHLYVLGGHHADKGVGIPQVEFARLDRDKLAWQFTQPLQQGRYGLGAVAHNNRLYAMGGLSGLEYLDSIEVSTISASGKLGAWRDLKTTLPAAMTNFASLSYKGHLYILGGSTADGRYLRHVYRAAFNEQGELGYFGQPAPAARPPAAASDLSRGQVVEVLQTEQYTYVQVQSGTQRYWVAGPRLELEKGSWIQHSRGVQMGGYFSRSLQRSFAQITFVSRLKAAGN